MDTDILVIDGKQYNKDNLHKQPFSNFHKINIKIDGITFLSTEQWIQYQKAILFEDKEPEVKIIRSTKALDCKSISFDIEDYDEDEWKEKLEEQCYRGIREKFKQH